MILLQTLKRALLINVAKWKAEFLFYWLIAVVVVTIRAGCWKWQKLKIEKNGICKKKLITWTYLFYFYLVLCIFPIAYLYTHAHTYSHTHLYIPYISTLNFPHMNAPQTIFISLFLFSTYFQCKHIEQKPIVYDITKVNESSTQWNVCAIAWVWVCKRQSKTRKAWKLFSSLWKILDFMTS